MSESVTRDYVDERVEKKLSHGLGIFMEHFDDKFKILQEGQKMIIERLDRFETETRQNFRKLGVC